MKKRYTISLILITLLLIGSLFIGTSYSLWHKTSAQNGFNQIEVGCFRITFTDSGFTGAGDINLTNAYPIPESKGKLTTPYKFKIENTCNIASNYTVNLETLTTSTFNNAYLRVLINDAESSVIYSSGLEAAIPQLSESSVAKKIGSGYLEPTGSEGSSVEYTIRLWIDYDATESTSNVMGKEWRGKISVYNQATDTKVAENLVTYLKGLSNSETVIQDDGTSDSNMRFIGNNPNNYVTFNGEEAGWRIMGVFNDNSHGESNSLVKLVRNTSIGEYAWDYCQSGTNCNDWSNSSLKSVLNDGYYNSSASYTDAEHDSSNAIDFSSTGLNTTAKSMIKNVTWKTGATHWDNAISSNGAYAFYTGERSSNVSNAPGYSTTWDDPGYVAIPYYSDFALATAGYDTVSRDDCLSQALYNSTDQTNWSTGSVDNDGGSCAKGSWMFEIGRNSSSELWSLSSREDNDDATYVYYLAYNNPSAFHGSFSANAIKKILPSVYLNSNVVCTNCDEVDVGSSSNPFELSLE